MFGNSSTNIAFVRRMSILQGANGFSHNILGGYFPENPGLSFIEKISEARSATRKEPSPCPEYNSSTPSSDIGQLIYREQLQIFVLGPSLRGKSRLIEYAANRNRGIQVCEDMYQAYNISGFLLQGVDVEINVWHIGNIIGSLGSLKKSYQEYKTCFMLVYDVNEYTTFQDVQQWIPSLRGVLDVNVPIVLVGYEEYEENLTSKLTPVSYSDGMKAKEDFNLKTYYEFSDMTGTAVSEMIFDAAHIALESKVTIPDSELYESEEK